MLLLRPNLLRLCVFPLLRLIDDLPDGSCFPLVWVDESLNYPSGRTSSISPDLLGLLSAPLGQSSLQYYERGLCGTDSRDPQVFMQDLNVTFWATKHRVILYLQEDLIDRHIQGCEASLSSTLLAGRSYVLPIHLWEVWSEYSVFRRFETSVC